MKTKNLTRAAMAAVLLALLTSAARAQMIPVTNFSFEDPSDASTGLTLTTDGYGNPTTTTIPGWTFSDGNYSGTVLASDQFVGAEAGGSYGGVGATGSTIAFLNISNAKPGTITSNSVTTIEAETSYLVSVAVGYDPANISGGVDQGFDTPGAVTLNLLANSAAAPGVFTVVSTNVLDTSSIPEASFENFTISLSAVQATALAGDQLEIQMEAFDPTSNSNNTFQPVFDDVTLEATPAPEPTTWAVLLGGLLLLVAIQRSRRMA